MAFSIVLGGDICPNGNNLPFFISGDADGIFHDLSDILKNADLSILNLECPLTDKHAPIPKNGPTLMAPPSSIKGIREAGIKVLNLANNHILDHGPHGLISTMETCAEAGIATVGAGVNLQEARRILIKKIGNIRVGIYSVAENEFSLAEAGAGGANPLDVIQFVREIKRQKGEFDFLIVLVHGGNENYPFPSPRLMETCRFFVEEGARVVVCQHSHCAGCIEEYQGAYIVYGQGNFIFDAPAQDLSWYEGFLVKVYIEEDLRFKIETIPYNQSNGTIGCRRMKGDELRAFNLKINERSRNIKKPKFVLDSWNSFCKQRQGSYLSKILGHSKIISKFNKNGQLSRLMYSRNKFLKIRNIVSCESHREVVETILKDM